MVGTKVSKFQQGGFVLVATLWTLAIMFIVAGAFHTYVEKKLALASAAKSNLQIRLDIHSTLQTLNFMIATHRMTKGGLTVATAAKSEYRDEEGNILTQSIGDEIRLDGSVYKGIGDVRFSIVDEAGLVALNSPSGLAISALLESYGMSPAEKTRLVNTLADYTDADDLVRLAGAEAPDYEDLGMPPPTNDFLRTAGELTRVLGWKDWLGSVQVPPDEWFAPKRTNLTNLNTMPPRLLQQLLGVSREQQENIVTLRQQQAFTSVDDFEQRTTLVLGWPDELYVFFPSDRLKIMLWGAGARQVQVLGIQYTPTGLLWPWLINYSYTGNNFNTPSAEALETAGHYFQGQHESR